MDADEQGVMRQAASHANPLPFLAQMLDAEVSRFD
jgi:hypothetical protein